MTLINDITQLKRYLGRAINKATTWDFILPYLELAQYEYIAPALGPEMLTELQTQLATNALTPVNRLLLELTQKALAFYAYQKYLPYAIGNDGDNGMQEQGTDATKPVRMGVLDLRRRETAENASKAIEQVLVQLFTFVEQYPTWKNSASYHAARSLFIGNATELTTYLPQTAGSYRLYTSLKTYLAEAERVGIKSLLGKAQFDALKAAQLTGNLSTAEADLLEKVGKAVATVAYAEALYNLNVVQTPGGQLRLLSDFDGIYNQKAVTGHELAEAQRRADGQAAAGLNSLKSFLTANAAAYPLYKTSSSYAAPGPNAFPDNAKYKSVFRMR
ncbi:hypothetical protein FAES_2303 [Fibrella aestuarina BUZ 2]|uniref:Uncharacterized protein n=1 Tax=Fibrella aestuarina BUZ 2 TaxID=1166018 RepID=I0K859_9BACT|nr:DUF6712 family protein [Fibrella aestuarina]CCH00312.1 hypothetical protein FAES_2303 [Fibrella aestuarina BUZ 2]